MSLHSRPRRGMAVAVALVAIVLIGALIAGTFFFSTQDYRVGRMSLDTDRALTAAEFGQTTALKDWTAAVWNQNLKIGDTLKRVYATGGSSTDTVTVTRIKYNMFWVVSSGRSESGNVSSEGRRRTGMLVRMDTPLFPFPGAFTGATTVDLSGSYTGTGNDAAPTGWTDCPPAGDGIAAVASVTVSNVTGSGSGCASYGCITGSPNKVSGTPDAADQAKILDGWDDLVAAADKNIVSSATALAPTPSLSGSACNTAAISNWGDPSRASPAGACESYFPIVHITCGGVYGATCSLGDAITGSGAPTGKWQYVAGGGGGAKGQGLLLVDGNLNIAGNFEWVGPIIVRGNVRTAGTGNKVTGGIHALNVGCTASTCNILAGTSSVNYSSCAIDKVMSLKAKPTIARHHAWAEMF